MFLNYQRLSILMISLLVVFCLANAEILPVKNYTTADGLMRDLSFCAKQDSKGFIWFCTNDGLSRFDGYEFINYTTNDGLPHRNVWDFLESRNGIFWAATSGGLVRFDPQNNQGNQLFQTFTPSTENSVSNTIYVLFEDSRGVLWCGTADGLFRVEAIDPQVSFHKIDLPKENSKSPSEITSIIEDQDGNIMVGMDLGQGLNLIHPDGKIEHFSTEIKKGKPESIKTLLKTASGEIWAGLSIDGGLCLLNSEMNAQRSVFFRCFTQKDGLPSNWVSGLYQTSDKKIWVGTAEGTASFEPDSNQIHLYRESQGLCNKVTNDFLEDRDGNLWITTSCGVKKISHEGLMRFGVADGLASNSVNGFYLSPNGELFTITNRTTNTANNKNISAFQINRFDGEEFTFLEPKLPLNVSSGWGSSQIVAQEKTGEWWLTGTNQAVYRFTKPGNLPQSFPIPDKEVFRIFADSKANIWVSTMYNAHLLKLDNQKFIDYKNEISRDNLWRHVNSFAEDSNGTIWMSSEDTDDLIRYQDGQFSIVKINSERKIGNINTVFFDSKNRLWLATMLNGIGRIDETNTDELKVIWYNRQNGLATDGTRGLSEDNFGRIYAGHGRGVDRLTPETGQIKHYTTADGLPQGFIDQIATDKNGNVWFGGQQGLARLSPEKEKPRPFPNILLTGLQINGKKQTLSEFGETSLPEISLSSNQTQVRIDFLGLGASLGEELKYQYKLEGDWIETSQRTVDFGNLAPGSYNFQVRAVSFDGLVSQIPAQVSFTIAAPIWQRWWFLTILSIWLLLLVYAVYRYRVAQLLKVERVRTRIATDLHDDIGANLSKISVLSEVARLKMTNGNEENNHLLGSIAEIARESVSTMSDIVWTINPKRDSVLEMIRKMREHAEETFVPKNVSVEFNSPIDSENIKLPMDLRREIYLIYKEAINNSAKHSDCQKIKIDFKIEGKEIYLKIQDDGKGFEQNVETPNGNGLENMKSRAKNLGGTLEITSEKAIGTSIKLNILKK